MYQLNNSPNINNQIHDVNLVPELNYEYIIVIRPYLIIINKLPFTLLFHYNSLDLTIAPLEQHDLYDYFPDIMDNDIYIKIEYFGVFYSSKNINLMEINTHIYIDLIDDNNTECLKCHLIKRAKEKIFKNLEVILLKQRDIQ